MECPYCYKIIPSDSTECPVCAMFIPSHMLKSMRSPKTEVIAGVEELIEKAINGDSQAQHSLGGLYLSGTGVPEDHTLAMKWFRKAAEQGDSDGQLNLGVMYGKGLGVPLDYVEAAKWFMKSAEQGNIIAQATLGLFFFLGQGVPKDMVQSYFWAHLWTSQATGDDHKAASSARDMAANMLSPEQLIEAQRLTREWEKSHQVKSNHMQNVGTIKTYNESRFSTVILDSGEAVMLSVAHDGIAIFKMRLGGILPGPKIANWPSNDLENFSAKFGKDADEISSFHATVVFLASFPNVETLQKYIGQVEVEAENNVGQKLKNIIGIIRGILTGIEEIIKKAKVGNAGAQANLGNKDMTVEELKGNGKTGNKQNVDSMIELTLRLYEKTARPNPLLPPLRFERSDSRCRYLLFCLSTVQLACASMMKNPDAVLNECAQAVLRYCLADQPTYFGGAVNPQEAVNKVAPCTQDFLQHWSRYVDIVSGGNHQEVLNIVSAMLRDTESSTPAAAADTQRLETVALYILASLDPIRAAFK